MPYRLSRGDKKSRKRRVVHILLHPAARVTPPHRDFSKITIGVAAAIRPAISFSVYRVLMDNQHDAPPGSMLISVLRRVYFFGFLRNCFLQKLVQK
jgi:hypothetical protein